MKEELMTEVMQHMLSYLDNAQMKQLRQVMEHALCRYNVTELEMKQEEDDSNNLIARFIAAKRIEGCSEKTLKYYQTTIDAMRASLGKNVRHINTEDLRTYLTEYKLMEALNNVIHEECPLCEQIKQKINGITFPNVPRDFLLTDDYVYYRNNNEFERAGRLAMLMSVDGDKLMSRRPLAEMTEANYLNFDGTAFGRFALMHAVMKSVDSQADIMPAIMIIYSDNTYDMDVFHADIKTTVYRKLNETAKIIEHEDVLEVCFMSLYSVICMEKESLLLSGEHKRPVITDILVVSSIDSGLNEKEYIFEGNQMSDPRYVGDVMNNGLQTSLNVSRMNMLPILKAFKRKREKC